MEGVFKNQVKYKSIGVICNHWIIYSGHCHWIIYVNVPNKTNRVKIIIIIIIVIIISNKTNRL